MKITLTSSLLAALAVTAIPLSVAPAAGAEICGDVGGRHVSVGGCTPGLVGDAVDAAVAGTAIAGVASLDRFGFPGNYAVSEIPSFPGEAPCISPTGLPYYPPGNAPCY